MRDVETKLPGVTTTIFTVMSQLAAEHGAINLGQGFPDFATPKPLVEALVRAARNGKNQYAPMAGLPELRHAIAAKVATAYGCHVDPDREITVTSGGTEALFCAIHAVVRQGDEVVILDPSYDSYEPAIELAGARAVHVPLDAHTFRVDWDRVRAAIGPRTRMLIVNSPHNPSGATLSPDDIGELRRIVDGSAIWLISDEVYEHIVFDGERHESLLRFPDLAARTFVISSFGKTYHCTGWKLGYCVAPAALTTELRKVHQYNTFCTFAPAQWAVAHMLAHHPEHHEQLGAFYQVKRDRFRTLLAQTKLVPLPVSGGYFQLADYSAISDLRDHELARWLTVEHKVTGIPLSAFYQAPPPDQRLIRFCFAKNDATLDAAIERLVKL